MQRYNLTDGWIDVRNKEEVTQRGRRGIQSIALGLKDFLASVPDIDKNTSLFDLAVTEEQADALLRLQEANIVALVAGWSYPEPAPTLATVGDMPSERYDEISVIVAPMGAQLAALDAAPTADDLGGADPNAPSGDSEPSDGLSRVAAE